jgi:hypothetical protein
MAKGWERKMRTRRLRGCAMLLLLGAAAAGCARADVAPLDWGDSRVRWWVRADKSNREIGSRFAWTGVQGSSTNCDYDAIQNVPEPNLSGGRPVLRRNGGWFEHRIFDGMCLWKGERQRSAIHTAEGYAQPSSVKRGRSYWFAFGGRFHADLFSQADPSPDRSTQLLDFHHKAPSSALSGQSPWAMYADREGYTMVLLWNKADSGVASPTGEVHWDGAQRVTLIRDRSKDTARPHFFAWRFKLDWNAGNQPYVEMYRQIGVDAPVEKIGRWDVPNTYRGSDDLLFPKYGLHQWYPKLSGTPTRSIDLAGALLVEDLPGRPALTPEVVLRSLTVALRR